MITVSRLDTGIFGFLLLYGLVFSLSVPLANFAMDSAVLLLIGRIFLSREELRLDPRMLLLAGIFLFVCLLSAWNGYNMKVSLEKTWQVGYNLIIPFVLGSFAVNTTERRQKMLVAISISLVAVCSYQIYLGILGRGSEGGFLGRLQLAGQILQAFPLLLTGAVWIAWWQKIFRIALLGVALMALSALLFTMIRGAWIALGVVSLLMVPVTPVQRKHKLGFALVMILLAGAVFLCQPKLQNSLVEGATLRAQSVSERFLMWKSAKNIFLDHPGLGIGLGNFGDLYERKYILPEAKEGRHPHPHNIYLQTLAEAGILGFAAFAAVWGYALRRVIRNALKADADFWQKAVPFSVLGFLLYGLTDNLIYHFPAGFQFCWFVIGAGWWKDNASGANTRQVKNRDTDKIHGRKATN